MHTPTSQSVAVAPESPGPRIRSVVVRPEGSVPLDSGSVVQSSAAAIPFVQLDEEGRYPAFFPDIDQRDPLGLRFLLPEPAEVLMGGDGQHQEDVSPASTVAYPMEELDLDDLALDSPVHVELE